MKSQTGLDKSNPDRAIKHYGHAWDKAEKAVKQQAPQRRCRPLQIAVPVSVPAPHSGPSAVLHIDGTTTTLTPLGIRQ